MNTKQESNTAVVQVTKLYHTNLDSSLEEVLPFVFSDNGNYGKYISHITTFVCLSFAISEQIWYQNPMACRFFPYQ